MGVIWLQLIEMTKEQKEKSAGGFCVCVVQTLGLCLTGHGFWWQSAKHAAE